MATLQVGDIVISYSLDGEGPWLTLLHGVSRDLRVWQPQVERLVNSFRLLRIDLRGHDPAEDARDVLSVLDALGVGATHLWGTHAGAGVALLLASHYPERIAMLVLEGAVIPTGDITMSTIRHHTLIVNGADDLPESLTTAESLERHLPHARRYLIPNAGPFPARDTPDAVTPLVAQFLEEVE